MLKEMGYFLVSILLCTDSVRRYYLKPLVFCFQWVYKVFHSVKLENAE